MTIYGTDAVSPTPGTGDLCTVQGTCRTNEGDPVAGVKVRCEVSGDNVVYTDSDGNKAQVSEQTVTTESNAQGVWSVTVLRSAKIGNAAYSFTVRGGRGGKFNMKKKGVTVPDAATVYFEDL